MCQNVKRCSVQQYRACVVDLLGLGIGVIKVRECRDKPTLHCLTTFYTHANNLIPAHQCRSLFPVIFLQSLYVPFNSDIYL